MADITYNDHAAKAVPTVDDFIPIWDVAAAQSKKATINNIINARLTGGGTIATGGFTLTVPATGTAMLLGTDQTVTGLKTFSAGLSFGAETLAAYAVGSWTPTLIGSTTPGSHTYNVQLGRYIKIGRFVFAPFFVAITTKDGGMAGNALIGGLPFAVASTSSSLGGTHLSIWSNLASSVVMVAIIPTAGAGTGTLTKLAAAGATTTTLVAADIGDGTALRGTLMYEAAT